MWCSEAGVQFCLLTWKNLILMKRKIFGTILLIVSIVIFPIFLMLANFYFGVHSFSEPVVEDPYEVKTDFNFLKNQISIHVLAFTPNDDDRVENIVTRAASLMNSDLIQVKGYKNESELENAIQNSSEIFGGIVFVDDPTNEIDRDIAYKIRLREDSGRWFTNELMPNPNVGPRQKLGSQGGSVPGYYQRGFLTIQRAIDTSIIVELGGNVSSMKTFLKKLSYPDYLVNTFYPILYNAFSFATLIGFCNLASLICREIVEEKEKKVKEYMKLLGLRNWIYWLSWFFKYLCLAVLSSLLITIIYHVRPRDAAVLNYTSPLVTFVFVLLFSTATVVFSFAVSTLFNKARTALFAMVIIYFITICLELYLKSNNNSNNTDKTFQRVLNYLFPNLSLGLGCRIILNFEKSGIGIHWNNLDQGCDDERGFSLLEVFFMFLVDLLLYGIITWYIDAVHPGEFGSPQPFYFPFQRRYWFGFSKDSGFDDLCDDSSNCNLKSEYFEANNLNCEIGIKIRNLTKVFNKDSKPAVNNLNLDICKDSITALLGHNGAGKTTTMFMLTGFVVPTKGSAFISRLNIRGDMDKIRKNLGFCPQSNILFDNLTVREHLELFARLKGRSNVKSDVSHMIAVLNLQAKRDTFSKKLSGGLKRKLSIGIALIGGSKFVILDEPTSGLDPEARREIWDLLKSHQQGRTMILTTHYMDEADYLGDKIAIMAKGVVQCYGSSMFLKKKYGIGYQLTIVQTGPCDPSEIHELITSKISDAQLKNRVGAEMTYHLPKESSSEFPSLFLELETRGKAIGVDSFGISVTSLEEVFIRVGELCEENVDTIGEKTIVNESFNNSELCDFESTFITDDISIRVGGISLLMLRIYAMMHKRFLYTLRNKWITLVQLVVPVAFAIMACMNFNTLHGQLKPQTSQPFSLDLEKYDHPLTIYATTVSSSDKLLQCYIKALNNVKGTYVHLNNQGFNYSSYDDMDAYFIKIGKQNLYHYRKSYQIATEIGSSYFLGFYNDESYHTVAIALTLLDNAWLQCLVSPLYKIRTINHPISRLSNETGKDIHNHAKSLGMMFSLSTSYGLSVLIASFCVFLINERKSGAKTSQYISGATSFTFWTATFIWDFLNYLIPVFLIIVVIMAFRLEGYSSGMNPGYVFLGLLAYGWSSLPLVYLMSFLFDKGSTGFNWITTVNLLTGLGTIFIIFIVEAVVKTTSVVEALEFVFYAFVSVFCLVRNLQNVLYNHSIAKSCSYFSKYISTEMCSDGSHNNQNECCPEDCGGICLDHPGNYFAWNEPGIGKSLIFMTLQGFVFFLILFIIESDILKNIRRRISLQKCYKGYSDGNVYEENADVRNERLIVMNMKDKDLQSNNNALILKKLTKKYKNVLAVDDICLQIQTGECFGLLGVNGAGKSSTFKMMTGEESISSGCAYVKGISVAEELTKTRRYVGYCPQFDSLIDQLTAEEHLELHWRLRGVSSKILKPYVKKSLQNFLINKYANKTVKQLSGGNKRKLSMAIALVGRPPLIFLDEPTTGIDPVSRRELWNVLSTARQTGSTIILTSHSMEECEALCTRLVIMVNGQFKCLGSTQHLKSRFGSGYTVMLKTKQTSDQAANMASIDNAKDFILENFPGSVSEFEGEGLINYRIEKSIPGATLANIFGILEGSREILSLEDYSVGQATLEQIFINFALNQQKSDHKDRSFVCDTSYDETDHV